MEDDAHGYGEQQSIAIFGQPGVDKFEFVMTGRHMTIRCDGNSAEHVAFGGPIFYGHAARASTKRPTIRATSFGIRPWPPTRSTRCSTSGTRSWRWSKSCRRRKPSASAGADGQYPGMPVTDMSSDQKDVLQKVLAQTDRALSPKRSRRRPRCLKAQGGLDKCSLAFYREGDIGNDQVWDNWRLEGPSFVWYFRGEPHVHVWVNVADDPSVKLNA